MAATCCASAQRSEIPRPSEVDLKEATDRFVRLFDRTCFQHRHSLQQVRTVAADYGWQELPGPFPYRKEEDQVTTLVAWGLWLGGVPYQVALNSFDNTAPALTCTVLSIAVDKASLPERMVDMLGLKVLDRFKTEEQDGTKLIKDEEFNLRVACFTALPKFVLIGHCGLVVVQHVEADPKREGGQ